MTKASFHWDDPLLLEQQIDDDERAIREMYTSPSCSMPAARRPSIA